MFSPARHCLAWVVLGLGIFPFRLSFSHLGCSVQKYFYQYINWFSRDFMKLPIFSPDDLRTMNYDQPILCILVMALSVTLLFSFPSSTAYAAIVWPGEGNPQDPNTLTSTTPGYIGVSSPGTVSLDGGSVLNGSYIYVGNQTNGSLDIGAGGHVNSGREYPNPPPSPDPEWVLFLSLSSVLCDARRSTWLICIESVELPWSNQPLLI